MENQGRINFLIANDFKGIFGSVKYNGIELNDWTMTKYPLENVTSIQTLINDFYKEQTKPDVFEDETKNSLFISPTIFHGSFNLTSDQLCDTYLNPTGWGKGVTYINGFNLGRYWPIAGPQITLYVPGELLKEGKNDLILIEYQRISSTKSIIFDDHPTLDG